MRPLARNRNKKPFTEKIREKLKGERGRSLRFFKTRKPTAPPLPHKERFAKRHKKPIRKNMLFIKREIFFRWVINPTPMPSKKKAST